MKITDYGLWFLDYVTFEICTEQPTRSKAWICLNGHCVGVYRYNDSSWVNISYLSESGFVINQNSPGSKDGILWDFPQHYIPSEFDFLEV